MTTEPTTTVKLGEKYRDSITGYEGIATGKFFYISGCVRIGLEALDAGKCTSETFDDERLIHVETEKRVARESRKGGPESAPSRPSPSR